MLATPQFRIVRIHKDVKSEIRELYICLAFGLEVKILIFRNEHQFWGGDENRDWGVVILGSTGRGNGKILEETA
jgi:hypothetical protein